MRGIDITICNWCTARRTLGAVKSVRKYYPHLRIIIVDDASEKSQGSFHSYYGSTYAPKVFDLDNTKLMDLPNVTYVQNEEHQGHGLSMNRGMAISDKELILFFDSDLRLTENGVFEKMLKKMKDKKVYAAGRVEGHEGAFVHPMFGLWRKGLIEKYHLSFDEGEFFCSESEKWEHVTTAQWASYQLLERGYKHKNISGGYVHLSRYDEELWKKYF